MWRDLGIKTERYVTDFYKEIKNDKIKKQLKLSIKIIRTKL